MRTKEQIETEINLNKNKQPDLQALDSNSNTAVWRLWVKMTAFIIESVEKYVESVRQAIIKFVESNRQGYLIDFYIQESLAFQMGHTLNPQNQYDTIDFGKRIITRSAASEPPAGWVVLKVAKGLPPVQLNNEDLTQFRNYMHKRKPAGVKLTIISLPAEPIVLSLKIIYNTQVGEEAARTLFDEALQQYITTTIAFGGLFIVNDFVKDTRQRQAILDVVVLSIEIDGNVVENGSYQAISGYYSYDPSSPLHSIEMIGQS